jgi:hypothetical protein
METKRLKPKRKLKKDTAPGEERRTTLETKAWRGPLCRAWIRTKAACEEKSLAKKEWCRAANHRTKSVSGWWKIQSLEDEIWPGTVHTAGKLKCWVGKEIPCHIQASEENHSQQRKDQATRRNKPHHEEQLRWRKSALYTNCSGLEISMGRIKHKSEHQILQPWPCCNSEQRRKEKLRLKPNFTKPNWKNLGSWRDIKQDSKIYFFIEIKQDSYNHRGHHPPFVFWLLECKFSSCHTNNLENTKWNLRSGK